VLGSKCLTGEPPALQKNPRGGGLGGVFFDPSAAARRARTSRGGRNRLSQEPGAVATIIWMAPRDYPLRARGAANPVTATSNAPAGFSLEETRESPYVLTDLRNPRKSRIVL